jgi:pimeloyl-ACP methyl ester carboxylesterase
MKTRTLDLDGPMHLADFGGSGPPLVLIHGLGASHTSWMAVAPTLSSRRRVLAPDLLGFGRTPLAGRPASIEANIALLARFLEREVREPAVLVGNSMGGLVSVLTAAAHPRAVSGLVLVCPALPRPSGAPVDRLVAMLFATYMIPGLGELFLRRRMTQVGPEKVLRDTLRLCGVDPEHMLPEALRASVDLAHERRGYPWADAAFLGSARSLIRTNLRRDRIYDLIRRLPAPALLIQGSADRLVPLASTAAAARLRPDWQLEVLEGVGHVPQLQVPERWVEIVARWLDR